MKRWMAGDGVGRNDEGGDDQDDADRSSMLRLAGDGECCLGSERFSAAIRRRKKKYRLRGLILNLLSRE